MQVEREYVGCMVKQMETKPRMNAQIKDLQKKVTALERAVKKSKDIEEKFSKLIALVPDAIVMINHKNRIVLLNKQAEKIFGYEAGELLNQPHDILIRPGADHCRSR